jgi:hypothetical protein
VGRRRICESLFLQVRSPRPSFPTPFHLLLFSSNVPRVSSLPYPSSHLPPFDPLPLLVLRALSSFVLPALPFHFTSNVPRVSSHPSPSSHLLPFLPSPPPSLSIRLSHSHPILTHTQTRPPPTNRPPHTLKRQNPHRLRRRSLRARLLRRIQHSQPLFLPRR